MTFSFRRVGVATVALIAAIGVGATGAPPPAGAVQHADTTALAGHRCTATLAHEVFGLARPSEQVKTTWADTIATTGDTLPLTFALANEDPWLGAVVDDLYTTALEREPDSSGRAYWINKLRTGSTVAFLGGNFYGSNEFYNGFGGGTPAGFITALYTKILERSPSPGDITFWTTRMQSYYRSEIAGEFFGSLESRNKRVVAMYTHLFETAPTTTVRDPYAEALRVGDTDIEVVAAMAASPAFATRASTLCTQTFGTYYPVTLGTPLDPTTSNPPFTVVTSLMDNAMPIASCIVPPGAATTGEAVLLVAQPGESAESWRAGLLAAGKLDGLRRVCRIEIGAASPDAWDATRSAQYIVRAVQRIAAWYGLHTDIVADGLGGLAARWALRWFPTIRAQVDDVVTIGVPNHGSVDTMYDTTSSPTPIAQQSRADSAFMKALNSSDETPGTPTYTTIASATDHVSVGATTNDRRESAWHLAGATNVRVQNTCPALVLRRTAVRDSAWVWAAARDAATNVGPTSPARLTSTPCGTDAGADALPTMGSTVVPVAEPPLPIYVPVADAETPPHTALTGLPTSDPGAGTRAYTEPLADRQAALTCPTGPGVARYSSSPTLLVPGGLHEDTGQMFASLAPRFSQTATGPTGQTLYPVCWLNVPDGGIWSQEVIWPDEAGADLRKSSEYVVHAVLQMYLDHGVGVDLIGHSRGGFDIAWAVKWWPEVQARVDDVVLVDTPIRGSGLQRYATPADYFIMAGPIGHQTRSDSRYMAALRLGDLTPGTNVSWTTIWSWEAGPIGGSGSSRAPGYDTRQNAWRWGDAANIVIHGHCAGTPANHGEVLTGDLGWAFTRDAINTAGPASASRVMTANPGAPTCGTTWRTQPLTPTGALTLRANTEPALPGYVWNTP